MEYDLINSISDKQANNFGDFVLGKLQHWIENPLSIIFDPINQTARETVQNISGNIGIIAGSEDKKGLAALNQSTRGFIDSTFNNISPAMMLLLGIGGVGIIIIAIKL